MSGWTRRPHRERPAYQWSVEVSTYVRGDAHRAGVARALYISLFAALVVQGFRNAYAGVTLPNEASVGLHTAVLLPALAGSAAFQHARTRGVPALRLARMEGRGWIDYRKHGIRRGAIGYHALALESTFHPGDSGATPHARSLGTSILSHAEVQ